MSYLLCISLANLGSFQKGLQSDILLSNRIRVHTSELVNYGW